MSLNQIHDTLLKTYGPQGWWPLSKGGLHSKHYNGAPLNDSDRFEIMVGAMLTQNTSWTNVEKALFNLNQAKAFTQIATIKTLPSLIRPAGYFNQKAKAIVSLKSFLKDNPIMRLKAMPLDKVRLLLLKQRGIGPETADSIILYALEKPIFVIDTYTRRIFSRLGYLEENRPYQEWQDLFMHHLKHDLPLFKEFHALIVRHAKEHCQKKPKCERCCIKKSCNFQANT